MKTFESSWFTAKCRARKEIFQLARGHRVWRLIRQVHRQRLHIHPRSPKAITEKSSKCTQIAHFICFDDDNRFFGFGIIAAVYRITNQLNYKISVCYVKPNVENRHNRPFRDGNRPWLER
uniref:AlNc14C132G6977 protein n=1 Tax=Albugo laibachii Nc14 TaxID=890382 RepID=F0WKC5_9STRA|nr:AlNc14C132G6977 [Albugo laibachii Nc14]|eukprot:CCA21729.1 AlNc14C132G6977 [Albugo laibachii Nc14]